MSNAIALEKRTKKTLHELYKVVFTADITFAKKCHMLDAIYRGEPWAWKIVGITQEALKAIMERDFRDKKGIQRHHNKKSRVDTYKDMFCNTPSPLSYEEWWKTFEEGDEVILVTKQQNDKGTLDKKTKVIPIHCRDGLFLNSTIAFRYTNTEREYLKELSKKYKIK